MTMTGDVLGTLRYMSPEQTLGRRAVVDHRSDVYSLGATLYELLSLEPVFGETERSDLLKQIAEQEPRAPRQINGRIPADLETIVLQAMRKIPDQRYATAQDLADDLQRFLDDQPIRAKPPTWRGRAVKWSRRHPAALWTAAAVLTVLAIASTTSAVLIGEAYQRESQQREQAEQQREMAEVQRREAETQRERAENHFRRVRVAVSEILVQAAEGRGMWEDIPSRLRKEFAKRVLSFYEGYVQQESSDRDVQFETAVAYISLANMAAVNKDLEQAETFLRQSRTILADLSEAHPESFEYRQQLAWANYRLGVVLDQRGDTSLAE
ncbi:MAG TPA: protein kinase, partial [Lacipirellulaceae bacterium]|nr:protein kinase [Lacipirellulaceae bacterium]